jgi:hypothetical protein
VDAKTEEEYGYVTDEEFSEKPRRPDHPGYRDGLGFNDNSAGSKSKCLPSK